MFAPQGASHVEIAATVGDRQITGLVMNEKGRLLIGRVERGTLVKAGLSFHLQVQVAPLEWRTIARG